MADTISTKTHRATSSQSEVAKLLITEQAAAFLGISKRTIQELTASRKLAFIKFGRNVRFDPADLAAFAEKNRVKAIGWKGGAF
jgi:excisionase family DNA binding protein